MKNRHPASDDLCPRCAQTLNEVGIEVDGERWHEQCAAEWVVQSVHAAASGDGQGQAYRGRANRTSHLMDAVVEGSPQIAELLVHGLWHALKTAVRATLHCLLPW